MSGHVILFQRDELIRKLTSIRCHIQYETNICVHTCINFTTAHRVRFLIRFGGFYGFILRFIPALFLFQKGLFTDDFTKMLD